MVRIIPDCGVLCKFFFTSTYSNFTFFYYQNSVERAAPVNPHRRAQPIKKRRQVAASFCRFRRPFSYRQEAV